MKSIFVIPDLTVKSKEAAVKAGLTSKYLMHHTCFWYNRYLGYRRCFHNKLFDKTWVDISDTICSKVFESINGRSLFLFLINRLLSKMGRPDLKFHKIVLVKTTKLYVRMKNFDGINILFLNWKFIESQMPDFMSYCIAKYLVNRNATNGNALCQAIQRIASGKANKTFDENYKKYLKIFNSIWFYKNDPNYREEYTSLKNECQIEKFATLYPVKGAFQKKCSLNNLSRKDYNDYFDYLLTLTRQIEKPQPNLEQRALDDLSLVMRNLMHEARTMS